MRHQGRHADTHYTIVSQSKIPVDKGVIERPVGVREETKAIGHIQTAPDDLPVSSPSENSIIQSRTILNDDNVRSINSVPSQRGSLNNLPQWHSPVCDRILTSDSEPQAAVADLSRKGFAGDDGRDDALDSCTFTIHPLNNEEFELVVCVSKRALDIQEGGSQHSRSPRKRKALPVEVEALDDEGRYKRHRCGLETEAAASVNTPPLETDAGTHLHQSPDSTEHRMGAAPHKELELTPAWGVLVDA
jgi:hypothetical protein